MRCRTLLVYYEDGSSKQGMKTSQPGPGGQQRIRRLEAKGDVLVTQKDQTATGETGIFDMQANTVTLFGNVVIARGNDVLRGQRLVVDLNNGVSRMEGGRVEGLFQPGRPQGNSNDSPRERPKPPSRPTRSRPPPQN
jgi:lipopolysaccharide export system protein LptA